MTLPLFPEIIAADRIEKECRKWKYQVMFSMLLSARALAIRLNNNLREYIFVRIYFSRELTCKFHERYFVNTNQKFNFTEDISTI